MAVCLEADVTIIVMYNGHMLCIRYLRVYISACGGQGVMFSITTAYIVFAVIYLAISCDSSFQLEMVLAHCVCGCENKSVGRTITIKHSLQWTSYAYLS